MYDGLDKDLPSFHTLFIRDEGSLCMLGGQWVSFHCADVVPSSTDDTIRVKRWLFSVSCKLEMRNTRKTRMSLPSTEPLSWRSPTVDRTEWPLSIFYRDWLKIKVLMIWKRVHPDTDFIVLSSFNICLWSDNVNTKHPNCSRCSHKTSQARKEVKIKFVCVVSCYK